MSRPALPVVHRAAMQVTSASHLGEPAGAPHDGPDGRFQPPSALDDPQRLAVLQASGLLTDDRPAGLERLARIAALALRAPTAYVNVVTADAEVAAARATPGKGDGSALLGRAGELEASFCRHVVEAGTSLVVDDARTHPLVCDNRATATGRVRAYLGAPFRAPAERGGHVLGSVCVVDVVPRAWSAEDRRVIEELAIAAGDEIEWRDTVAEFLDAADRDLAASERRARALSAQLERQLAELEAVYAHAGVGLCVFDTELRWVRINERLAEMNGLPAEAHVGRRVRELLPAVAADAEALLRRVLETGVPLLDVELVGETPARPGQRRAWREHFLPLRDAGGRVVGVNVVCEEVTERRQAEAERARLLDAERAARGEAEAASRAKSEFLATMSHELRTPLNAIAGYVELLELALYGPVTAEQRDTLGRIRRSQQHLLRLISEVLNYARIEAGAVRYRLDDVPMTEALAAAQSIVEPQARAKRLTLELAPCGPTLMARADGEKLQQVLINLLSNAVKFTESGGTVALECSAEGGRVLVRVRDTGIGVAAEELERIFEPFVQVDGRLTRTQDGAGLGLAISRDLTRGMGGDLLVESVPGEGSVFTLVLPRGRHAERGREAAG